ncbi:HAD superfamily [Perilla frutescens var. frutescens]|nr:HAD superfamily [Perilla frutescens var. frutescens]
MILLKKILFFSCILPLAFAQETFDAERPLIIEINEAQLDKWSAEDVELHCTSWRLAVEANNLSPWKTIAEECGDYVREYMTEKGYRLDLQRVSNEAVLYARSVNLSGDGKFTWVFDIDETLLSNLPYYAQHGYGSEIFDSEKFDHWVEMGMAPAIKSSLKVYEEVMRLGFKVILLTGRSERHRSITVENLLQAGFRDWDMLILRSSGDHGKTATRFKSEKRRELVHEGYEILGNSGDQWSDLLGSSMSIRSFKLPNPMYYIP